MTEHSDPPTPDEDFLPLVVRHFDGDLDTNELADLNALLRTNPTRRRMFAEYATQISLLREASGAERQRAEVLSTPAGDDSALTKHGYFRRRRIVRFAVAASFVAAAIAIAVSIWRIPRSPQPAESVAIGLVEPASGEVRIVSPDGATRSVEARTEVRVGDTVRTEGLRGAAAVVYADGTRLTLVGDTAVTFAGSVPKNLRLITGSVAADVATQPAESPMVLTTPTARVEVLGTEFHCQAFSDRTDVSVTRGLVRVVRTGDGAAVEVSAGRRVLARDLAPLTVEAVPGRMDTWELDFELGLPPDLRRGRLVTEGLPRGSKGAVAAVPAVGPELAGYFEIASPEEWQQGLFAFHPDSHLHVTYKMDRPNWVNVFVCARGPGPDPRHVGNYLFNGPEIHTRSRPGRWQTISVPLTSLRRAGMNDPSGPRTDEVPYLVLFSSLGDRGLVIDRVWVTRSGPGFVRVTDVD